MPLEPASISAVLTVIVSVPCGERYSEVLIVTVSTLLKSLFQLSNFTSWSTFLESSVVHRLSDISRVTVSVIFSYRL